MPSGIYKRVIPSHWIGKKRSKKTKKKISAVLKGRKLSEKTREKMSKARKGKIPKFIPDNKGKKLSPERRVIALKNLRNYIGIKGKENPNWNGGITAKNQKIRGGREYNLWRMSVFVRDNFTCQKCGNKNGQGHTVCLNAHHIKSFAKYKELRTSIENGITLCEKCHKEMHKKYVDI